MNMNDKYDSEHIWTFSALLVFLFLCLDVVAFFLALERVVEKDY